MEERIPRRNACSVLSSVAFKTRDMIAVVV
jgi:hypothetical protein